MGEGENQVTVTVLGREGCRVKLGIEAAAEIPVYREEVFNRIHGVRPEPDFMREPLRPGYVSYAGW